MQHDLPSPLPTIQNGELKIIYPLNFVYRGDNTEQFARKYTKELENVYKILTNLISNQSQNVGNIPYSIKIEDDKFYIRNKQNDSWIFLFDILNPDLGNNETVSEHIQEILDSSKQAIKAAKDAEQFMVNARKATQKISLRTYETINDMKKETDIQAGMSLYIQGAETFNDGKAAFYIVKEMAQSVVDDDYEIVKLKEGLYAIRILEQDKYLALTGGTVNGDVNVNGDLIISGIIDGHLKGTADISTKAINDNNNNKIDETYISNITFKDGVITLEKGNKDKNKFIIDNFEESPTVPTPEAGDISLKIANTKFVNNLFNLWGGILDSTTNNDDINIEFANGICIKFATVNIGENNNTQATISFSSAFKNNILFVFPSFGDVTEKTNNNFIVSYSNEEKKSKIKYIAIGLNK